MQISSERQQDAQGGAFDVFAAAAKTKVTSDGMRRSLRSPHCMKMKKIFAPPLVPVVMLVAFCLFAAIADRIGPPTVIDGHADNAPGRALFMLIVMTPLFYLLFVLLNGIDAVLQRITRGLRWFSTIVLTVGLGSLFTTLFFRPGIDAPQHLVPVACASLLGATLVIVPMSVWRRKIETGADE